ncbi:MAG: N-formylglutamate amidohydrolase, partial [Verrucomicrobia bacterium]|nr:N-formylglutamate amidohydrolase [Verrucomicrobiota bacterium]
MTDTIYSLVTGEGPLVAAAIHDGHAVRSEVSDLLLISDEDRLREEDPFTAAWADIAPTRIIGTRSRFEVDLNRAREKAVYVLPEDAWGLDVWKDTPSDALIDRSLAEYDLFYSQLRNLFASLEAKHGRFVVL